MNFLVYLLLLALSAFVAGHPNFAKRLDSGAGDTIPHDPGFNAATQLIDVTGAHAYVPPNFAAGDQRGPCPALNAMANHGYLPHNGWATIQQYADASTQVFGMDHVLSTILAILGVITAGDPLAIPAGFSMGGYSQNHGGLLGGLLPPLLVGQPKGLDYTHIAYEADASIVRGDFDLFNGDAYTVQPQYFVQMYNLLFGSPGTDAVSAMQQHRCNRVKESIAENPYYFNGPVAGFITGSVPHIFVARLFSNKSAENHIGALTPDILKSLFGVKGGPDPSTFTYEFGTEQIPHNWYKTAIGDEYGLVASVNDIVAMCSKCPIVCSIGGNTGSPNSFVGVDLGSLTGGVFNAGNLLQGNNAICLALEASQIAEPSDDNGLLENVIISLLGSVLGPVLPTLGCPSLARFNYSLFDSFPGYAKAGGSKALGGT